MQGSYHHLHSTTSRKRDVSEGHREPESQEGASPLNRSARRVWTAVRSLAGVASIAANLSRSPVCVYRWKRTHAILRDAARSIAAIWMEADFREDRSPSGEGDSR